MIQDAIKTLCRAFAIVCVALGGYGSLLCVPYALCNNLLLISAAGIYFIAGAVMMTGGLIAYTLLIKTV